MASLKHHGAVHQPSRADQTQAYRSASSAVPARVAATATSDPGPSTPKPHGGRASAIEDPAYSDCDGSSIWLGDSVVAGIADADGWREPGQTLTLEASTSPASQRELIPVLRRPRRAAARVSSHAPGAVGAAATSTSAAGAAPTAAAADPSAGSGPSCEAAGADGAAAAAAAAAAATTKAAAAAAVAAKRRARAAAGAAAAAAATAVAAGSAAPRTMGLYNAAVASERADEDAVAGGAPTAGLQPSFDPEERHSDTELVSTSLSSNSSNNTSSSSSSSSKVRGRGGEREAAESAAAAAAAAAGAAPQERPTAAVLQRRVKRLRRSGRLADALDLSYRGMSYYPLVRSFWASAASLEARIGRVAVARRLLDEALGRWPGNAALLLALGQLYGSQGEYDAAADAFRTALKREPGNAAVLHAWGTVEAARGDLAAARSRFRAASQAAPDMAHSYTSWARLEAAAGDEAAARRLFAEGHGADPTHVPLLHAWAMFELNHDKQSAARRLLDRSLELNPHHIPSWMALGTLEWRQGSPAKSREVFERGLSTVGPSAPLLSALAELELRLMNTKNARQGAWELFVRLRGTTPRHVPALLSEAKMEHRAGNRARAQQLYCEAAAAVAAGVVRGSEGGEVQQPLQLHPPSAASDERDTCHQQQQQDQLEQEPGAAGDGGAIAPAGGAAAAAAAAATLSSAAVLQAWAQSHLCNGDLAAAEQLLLAVESVKPTNGHLCHTRGLLCQREGALEAAERWFRRGLGCRASRDGALLCYEGLAELLAFQGRKDEARAVWQAGAAAVPTPTSRFLRQAALFEKKERNWAAAATLFADSDYRSWLQWGVSESRQRNWDAAERCFQRGVATAPGYPYLWLAYVSSLQAQRRVPDARVVLRTATRHCPRHAQLWMEWALMEAAAGDAEAARRLFRKARGGGVSWGCLAVALTPCPAPRADVTQGAEVPPPCQHEPLYQAWAAFEEEMGNRDVAERLLQRAEQVAQARRARRQAAERGAGAGSGGASAAGASGEGPAARSQATDVA
ncbi:hypothetical protein PLESTF_000113000 [Pleodorina starrii]|nr:hypothetical protein PLESTF_000113000 [Pleodorina starrii]